MGGIGQIVQAVFGFLPPWVSALLVLTLALVLAPRIKVNLRSRRVRELVRRMVRATEAQRVALEAQAFTAAGEAIPVVSLLATEAHRRQLPMLHARAMEHLGSLPHGRVEVARIRRDIEPPRAAPEHPLQTVVRVEQLLASGIVAAARARMEEGLEHHPGHPELLALRPQVEAAERALDEPEAPQ